MKEFLKANLQFPSQCFFEFTVPNQERFQLLSQFFEILKQEKQVLFARFNISSDEENDEEGEQLVKENTQRRDEIIENLFVLLDDQTLTGTPIQFLLEENS